MLVKEAKGETMEKKIEPRVKGETSEKKAQISAPNFKLATFVLTGNSDYVSNKFSDEAKNQMKAKQEAGAQGKKGVKREPKDFDKACLGAMHCFKDGTAGIPASCFRQAMISACRLVGFKMTLAKLALFVEADGADVSEGAPLVRITGSWRRVDSYVRNETGVADIRPRPHWDPGWQVRVRVRYDADLFMSTDVENLLLRVGMQVGIGAGRPDSKESAGQGWGTFDVEKVD